MRITAKFTDVKTTVNTANEPPFKATGPTEMIELFRDLIPNTLEQEHFAVAVFNGRNELLGSKVMFMGTTNSAGIDFIIMARYIVAFPSVARFAVCHNHPSGTLEPSREDLRLTSDLVKMGKSIGVKLMEHVILTDQSAFSFTHSGIMTDIEKDAIYEHETRIDYSTHLRNASAFIQRAF